MVDPQRRMDASQRHPIPRASVDAPHQLTVGGRPSGGGRNWLLLCSLGAAGLLELSLILAVVYARRLSGDGEGDLVFRVSEDQLRLVTPYTNHTTVADVPEICGAVPRKVYGRRGSVADCAVAFALCMAVVAPHRVGLAGGFFATIYDRKSKDVVVLDAHPSAPLNISEVEDVNASSSASSAVGGKSMATPGYVPGLEALHSRYGRLSWSSLFEDAISLAHFGFPVYPELAATLARFRDTIAHRRTLKQIFWNQKTADVYHENETLRQPALARTLSLLAQEGAAALSQGSLTKQFVRDLEERGSLVSHEDLVFYKAMWKAPVRSAPVAGVRLHAPPPPAGGALLAFMLATMDMFRPNKGDLLQDGPLTYHRLLETIKFAHPFREDLGDDGVENVADTVHNLVSRGQALKANGRISDSSTFSDAIFYVFDMQLVRESIHGVSERAAMGRYADLPRDSSERHPEGGGRGGGVRYDQATRRPSPKRHPAKPFEIKHAAANAVFMAPSGDAIAFSGSLGMIAEQVRNSTTIYNGLRHMRSLGSRQASPSTGLVLNNEMHAFTERLPDRYWGHAGVSLNFASPGKRPLSPLAPSLVLDAVTGSLVAALAASEDFELPQYAALVMCQLFLMNKTVVDAVTASKVRYRPSLKGVFYDSDLPQETVRELQNKGHRMLLLEDNVTNAVAIFSDENHRVYPAVNDRIGGYFDGS